ncbi:sulfatase-like hydrolase/transferase [Olleya sp. ITB9]|uniref:sulfatase-like hydrolase/transferase n=1 Tax=Olleya sp. ITB9 TaxID=1715648 RepID=UPI0006D08D15|nr:sulfatase-like hydrolase/transferase [Olleya sp. ITB9]
MDKSLLTNIKSLFRLALVFSIPFFVLVILGFFKIPDTFGYIKEVIGFVFLTALFFCVTILFSKAKIRQVLSLIFVVILSILVFIKISFYHNYNVKLSASALFVIFETDTTESVDFLSNYFDGFVTVSGAFIVFVLPLFVYFILKYITITGQIKFLKLIALIFFIIFSFIIHKRFNSQNLIITSFKSYTEYSSLIKDLKIDLAKPISSFVAVEKSDDNPETHIVIIGESTSNWHMQLYGYDRPTNPKLTKIKDQLIIFDSVISPNVHTIVSLDKILTFSDINSPNKKNNTSIVQLANAAGYDTYWISNQRPVGMHERISSIVGNAATEKYFIATDNYDDVIYDETLLPVLDTVLKKKTEKKIIFIHLIGTHGRFDRRYPEKFNYFQTNKPNTKFNHKKALKLINDYDNAVRYNDYIVKEVIDRVKSQQTYSFVLYFSDHGDELYDTMDLVGHNEYWATRPMYEIPFIAWFSDAYKQSNISFETFLSYKNRAYNLEDFIYSFSDLAQIRFKELDSTKSIFSKAFIRKPRLIKDGEDYDKRVKLKEN